MACERSLDALSDVAAGAEPTRELEEHLAGCGACRARLAQLRQALARMDGELAGLLGDEPSPALKARIRSAVQTDAASPVAWGWGRRAWLSAAATILFGVALAAFLAGRPGPVTGRRLAATAPAPSAAQAPLVSERERQSDRSPAPASASSPEAPGVASGDESARVRELAHGQMTGTQASTRRRTGLPHAEILVPADEAVALLRLAGVLVEGRVEAGELMTTSIASSALLPEPVPIEVRPLEIAPLEPSSSSGT